jgi:lipoprotein-anchoring transpeptidase ErfK/SrfK
MTRPWRSIHFLTVLSLPVVLVLLASPATLASAAPSPQAQQRGGQPAQQRGGQPSAASERWVQNFEITEQWSGPDEGAESFGLLRKFSYLRLERADGGRYYVFNPRTSGFAYVDAAVLGPSDAPPADYLEPYKVLATLDLPARLIGKAELYADPVQDDAVWLRTGGHNTPVKVEAKVTGDGGDWYRLSSGEFVSGNSLRLPPSTPARYRGKWIDADLNDPVVVTAYEGDRPVYSTLAIKGTARWPTPVGNFTISRRVFNETMSSEGLGIPRNAPGGYYVKDVLFTQYFTGDGAALHYNYWSGNWGYAGSHGCLGMNYEDSHWFWNWVDIGTPISVHY